MLWSDPCARGVGLGVETDAVSWAYDPDVGCGLFVHLVDADRLRRLLVDFVDADVLRGGLVRVDDTLCLVRVDDVVGFSTPALAGDVSGPPSPVVPSPKPESPPAMLDNRPNMLDLLIRSSTSPPAPRSKLTWVDSVESSSPESSYPAKASVGLRESSCANAGSVTSRSSTRAAPDLPVPRGRQYAPSVEPVRIFAPRRHLALMLAGSIAFVSAGLWMVLNAGPVGWVIGSVSVMFFGLGGAYYLTELVVRRPILQVDQDGILDRASLVSAGRLRWSDVREIRILSVEGQRMLSIYPSDPAAVMARANPIRRAVMRANDGLGFPPVNVPVSVLPCTVDDLLDLMRRHNPDLTVVND